jgi:hypothetical protein
VTPDATGTWRTTLRLSLGAEGAPRSDGAVALAGRA